MSTVSLTMTPRDIGHVALKLIGLWFGFRSLLFMVVYTQETVGSVMVASFRLALLQPLLMLSAAAVLIARGDQLSRWLFPAEPTLSVDFSREDLLFTAVTMVGLLLVASNLAEIVRVVGTAIWLLGLDRRDTFSGWDRLVVPPFFDAIVTAGLGLLVVLRAGRIATFLDSSRARSETEH